MKEKMNPPININGPDFVNRWGADADRIEGNPEKMLALVDLIFALQDETLPPS
jgi:hypothetical protein